MIAEVVVSSIWLGFALFLLVKSLRQLSAAETLYPADFPSELDAPFVTVIIPARNEADVIEICLSGLIRQNYPADRFRILVVNDHSTDETAALVRDAASSDSRIELIEARVLPHGWTGKSNACWQGASLAHGDWFYFIDADVAPEPGLLSVTVGHAISEGLDLLSGVPFFKLETFWERMLFPSLLLWLALYMDTIQVNDPEATEAAAASGSILLMRREAYEHVKGHAHPTVRNNLSEDLAMARVVKQAGYSLRLVRGHKLAQVRMYTSLRSLWEGMSKSAFSTFGGTPARVATSAVGSLILGWGTLLLPLWAAASILGGRGISAAEWTFGISFFGSTIVFLLYVVGSGVVLRIPYRYCALFPFSFSMGAAITVWSLWQRVRGSVTWKGRSYVIRKE